ncbi:MAG TPA: TonB-dependent receptor plug domain-containing protein [Gemmatimonadaceae bacterium]|nr:TonB-dependent receptor plug domain-containing protein [Gemmatimonadaceae bacterium]
MWTRHPVLFTLAGAALLGTSACGRRSHETSPRPAADSVEMGYGAQPKDKVTGAVTTLSNKDFRTRPQGIEEFLRGKVAGLEIIRQGNGFTFRIRGAGSMIVDKEPLVIVDGVMIQEGNIANALAGLTPDDIKQVNVLKDVASTSIYGGRGAGGVILITTTAKSPPSSPLD